MGIISVLRRDEKGRPVVRTNTTSTISEDVETGPKPSDALTAWSPTRHELLIMLTLSIISLMVALDACIIVTSLSVSGNAEHET